MEHANSIKGHPAVSVYGIQGNRRGGICPLTQLALFPMQTTARFSYRIHGKDLVGLGGEWTAPYTYSFVSRSHQTGSELFAEVGHRRRRSTDAQYPLPPNTICLFNTVSIVRNIGNWAYSGTKNAAGERHSKRAVYLGAVLGYPIFFFFRLVQPTRLARACRTSAAKALAAFWRPPRTQRDIGGAHWWPAAADIPPRRISIHSFRARKRFFT